MKPTSSAQTTPAPCPRSHTHHHRRRLRRDLLDLERQDHVVDERPEGGEAGPLLEGDPPAGEREAGGEAAVLRRLPPQVLVLDSRPPNLRSLGALLACESLPGDRHVPAARVAELRAEGHLPDPRAPLGLRAERRRGGGEQRVAQPLARDELGRRQAGTRRVRGRDGLLETGIVREGGGGAAPAAAVRPAGVASVPPVVHRPPPTRHRAARRSELPGPSQSVRSRSREGSGSSDPGNRGRLRVPPPADGPRWRVLSPSVGEGAPEASPAPPSSGMRSAE